MFESTGVQYSFDMWRVYDRRRPISWGERGRCFQASIVRLSLERASCVERFCCTLVPKGGSTCTTGTAVRSIEDGHHSAPDHLFAVDSSQGQTSRTTDRQVQVKHVILHQPQQGLSPAHTHVHTQEVLDQKAGTMFPWQVSAGPPIAAPSLGAPQASSLSPHTDPYILETRSTKKQRTCLYSRQRRKNTKYQAVHRPTNEHHSTSTRNSSSRASLGWRERAPQAH